MKIDPHHCPEPARAWYTPEAAQFNFALFPDMYFAAPPPHRRERHPSPPQRPQEDGLFVQFCGWLGSLVDRWVGPPDA